MAAIGRARAALGVVAVVLTSVGTIAAVQRQPEGRTAVGTNGPAYGAERLPRRPTATTTTSLDDAATDAVPPTTTTPAPGQTTTTTVPATSSALTSASSSGGIVDDDSTGPGPHDLLDRVVYLNDTPAPSSLWSVRPDGSGRRLEVACPPPADLGTAGWWWRSAPFDLSPDGRYVIRSCPVVGSDLDGMRSEEMTADLVIQDVDGSGSRTLWRYGSRQYAAPEWSPDGQRLAIATQEGIVVMDADGTDRRTLTLSESLIPGYTLSWSPDGRRLLTSSLEVIDIATGAVSHPLEAAEPWPHGADMISTNAFRWDGEGLWWVGSLGSVSHQMEELPGIWRLDPATHAFTRAVTLANEDYVRMQAVAGGWWGCTGGNTMLHRISPDGTIHETGDHAFWLSVAG